MARIVHPTTLSSVQHLRNKGNSLSRERNTPSNWPHWNRQSRDMEQIAKELLSSSGCWLCEHTRYCSVEILHHALRAELWVSGELRARQLGAFVNMSPCCGLIRLVRTQCSFIFCHRNGSSVSFWVSTAEAALLWQPIPEWKRWGTECPHAPGSLPSSPIVLTNYTLLTQQVPVTAIFALPSYPNLPLHYAVRLRVCYASSPSAQECVFGIHNEPCRHAQVYICAFIGLRIQRR